MAPRKYNCMVIVIFILHIQGMKMNSLWNGLKIFFRLKMTTRMDIIPLFLHNKLEEQGIIEESLCAAALQNTTVGAATVLHGTKEVQLLGDSNFNSAHP
ncbi:hypothetical protein SUGI_0631540 [Cryptomeria japonica]|nr:hypothetical protein SUGI_0631540 [Cryptomeria japonica]